MCGFVPSCLHCHCPHMPSTKKRKLNIESIFLPKEIIKCPFNFHLKSGYCYMFLQGYHITGTLHHLHASNCRRHSNFLDSYTFAMAADKKLWH